MVNGTNRECCGNVPPTVIVLCWPHCDCRYGNFGVGHQCSERLSDLQSSGECNSSAPGPRHSCNMIARLETPNCGGEGEENMNVDEERNKEGDEVDWEVDWENDVKMGGV